MSSTLLLEITVLVLTGLVMIVGLVGAVVPVLPGAPLIWLAALGYGLVLALFGQPLFGGWVGWIAIFLLTGLVVIDLGLQFVVTHSVAARGGVSFQATLASVGLGLLALPIFPPIGPLVGSVLGLFLVEYFRHGKDARKAWRGVMSYAQGCGWAMIAEVGLCLAMIAIWVLWVVVTGAGRLFS